MTSLPRPCAGPGDGTDCPVLVPKGTQRCSDCARAYESRRGSVTERFGSGWARLSAAVLKRDRYECQLQLPGCLGRATTADHIIPKSRGGTATMDNLQAACRPCNSAK